MATVNEAVFCMNCGEPLPEDRIAQSTTCQESCAIARKKMLLARRDAKQCRYCQKPSTLEQRAAFMRFRKLERKRPDLVYPAEFQAWRATWLPEFEKQFPGSDVLQMAPQQFATWWRERQAADETKPVESETIEPQDETDQPKTETIEVEAEAKRDDSIYIMKWDRFGKKGEPCEMLRTKMKLANVVQVRFADGFMPVVERGALRQWREGDPKFLLDTKGAEQSTLLASGKSHGGE